MRVRRTSTIEVRPGGAKLRHAGVENLWLTERPTWCRWTGLNLCWSSSWQQLMALRTAMEGGLAPSGL